MKRRPFFGLVKPTLQYSMLPDLSSLRLEEVPASRTATFFVPGACEATDLMTLKVGDEVKAGQRLAPLAGGKGYAVSSLAGEISVMEPYTDAYARKYTAITVQSGSQQDWDEPVGEDPDLDTVLQRLQYGPGALCLEAFADPEKSINTVVILGMDQDLLVTARQHVIKECKTQITQGVATLKRLTRVNRVVMVVPASLADVAKSAGCQVQVVDAVYPNASPKMIMHRLLGQTVPAGQTPEDLGVLFLSAEAVAALGESCSTGRPCTDKVVTLINKDEEPVNVKVRVGTPIKDVLAVKRIMVNDGDRLVLGGPMTGVATYSTDLPVQPDTDAILVQDSDSLPEIADNACINCGDCVRVCPARIQVNILVRHLENTLYEEAAETWDLLSCVDCGLCTYVCPAQIPVFQYIGLAKHELSRLAAEAE